MSRLLLATVLICASASVSAGPGSAGQCPEMEQEAPEIAAAVADATKKPAVKPRMTSSTPQRKPVKTTPTARGEVDAAARVATPRWHSFLPGMFR